jgi:hypothetical protein
MVDYYQIMSETAKVCSVVAPECSIKDRQSVEHLKDRRIRSERSSHWC